MKREPEHQNLKERHQKGATLGGLLAFRWEVQPACGNSLGGGWINTLTTLSSIPAPDVLPEVRIDGTHPAPESTGSCRRDP